MLLCDTVWRTVFYFYCSYFLFVLIARNKNRPITTINIVR